MNENIENQEVVPGTDVVESTQTPEVNPIEQRAMEMGWRPKEEFNGDEADFIDAAEFVRRKPLFDRIEQSSREIKNMRKAFDALKQHYTTVKEAEYTRALTALKNARKEAMVAGDGDRFESIDDEIKRVEVEAAAIKTVDTVAPEPQVHPEFAAWAQRNQWYNTERHMRVFADDYGTRLAQQGVSPSDVLREVEKAVKKEFPNKFVNRNKDSAPNVESSGGSGNRRDSFELSDEERNIMNTLIKSDPKTFTKEKYIADLKAAKGYK